MPAGGKSGAGAFCRAAYLALLIALALLVLAAFLRPTPRHAGINQYERALFLDMVEGRAHRPFVCRALLPAAVRGLTALAPQQARQACADLVARSPAAARVFERLYWEQEAAFQYLAATLLMLLCFAGFGHCALGLTERLCGTPEKTPLRLLLLAGVMLGLPPFFRYVSYVYDPPQLFLFTLALLVLAAGRVRTFFFVFAACCLNKETAVLLIPVYLVAMRGRGAGGRELRLQAAGLAAIWIGIKAALTWTFRDNPGSFVEFHFLRNIWWTTFGWSFGDLVVILILAGLVFYRWSEKPPCLRRSFLWVLVPLVVLAIFLGWVDEWRGYYEAYPLAFALAVHSLTRPGAVRA